MSPQRKMAECVFKKGFVTDTVDPQVDLLWKNHVGGKTPFGDLRNMWRRHHCRTLNPYGDSENCPYEEKDCARAFYAAVREVTRAHDRIPLKAPVGYFIRVAKSTAAVRADAAVGLRANRAKMRPQLPPRTIDAPHSHQAPSPPQPRPDSPGMAGTATGGLRPRHQGDPARTGRSGLPDSASERAAARLPGLGDGPVGLGDVLRNLELRSRPRDPDDREEGT
jgi:hypothetical protein